MRSSPRPRMFDMGAAGLAAGLSAVELIRLVLLGGVSPGHTMLSSLIGGILFCVTLAVAAVGMALHRQVGWVFGLLGFVAAAAHGIIVLAGGGRIGTLYVLGAFVLFGLIVKSLHWYRSEIVDEIRA